MNDIDAAFEEFGQIIDELTDLQAIAGDLTQQLDNYAYGIKQMAPLKDGRLRNSIQL